MPYNFDENRNVYLNGRHIGFLDLNGDWHYVGRSRRTRVSIGLLQQLNASPATLEFFREIDRQHEAARRSRTAATPAAATMTFDPERTYGIEIECFKPHASNFKKEVYEALEAAGIPASYHSGYHEGSHTQEARWICEYDGSIADNNNWSCECISPVLKGEAGLETIKRVMEIIRCIGGKVNHRCGFHVHHGAAAYPSTVQPLKVLNFFRENERWIDQLLAPSRRESRNQYCQSMAGITTVPRWRIEGKYQKLNYRHFSDYGTLEFRCHQGTLNGAKAVAWVKLTQAMMTPQTETATSSIEEMLTKLNISSDVREYWLAKYQANQVC